MALSRLAGFLSLRQVITWPTRWRCHLSNWFCFSGGRKGWRGSSRHLALHLPLPLLILPPLLCLAPAHAPACRPHALALHPLGRPPLGRHHRLLWTQACSYHLLHWSERIKKLPTGSFLGYVLIVWCWNPFHQDVPTGQLDALLLWRSPCSTRHLVASHNPPCLPPHCCLAPPHLPEAEDLPRHCSDWAR